MIIKNSEGKSVDRNFRLQTIHDAWFEEYKALRDDILRRAQLQVQIIVFIAIISGVSIPLAFKIVDSGLFIFFLLISPIYFIAGWLYFEQDMFLTQAATYLNSVLRPKIIQSLSDENIGEKLDNDSIFYWEIFRNRILFGDLKKRLFIYLMTLFRIMATTGPGLAAILGFIYYVSINSTTSRPWTGFEFFLVLFDIFLALIIFSLALKVITCYKRISIE
jgi:hypothetical protein